MPEFSGRSRWAAALDDLEQRAHDAVSAWESLGSWQPPEVGAPIPRGLAQRAAEVLAAQRQAIAILEAEERKVTSLLRALNKVPQPFPGDTPVYVDTVS